MIKEYDRSNVPNERVYNILQTESVPDELRSKIAQIRKQVKQDLAGATFNKEQSFFNKFDNSKKSDSDFIADESFIPSDDVGIKKLDIFDGMDSIVINRGAMKNIVDDFSRFYNQYKDKLTGNSKKSIEMLNETFKETKNIHRYDEASIELATRYLILETSLKSETDHELLKVLKSELTEIKDNFSTDRKTEIQKHDIEDIDTEDLIIEEDVVVTVSHQGYIKRVLKSSYKVQKRGGKGKKAMTTRDEDFLEQVFAATTRDTILFFTSVGKVYSMKAYELPAGTPTSRGKAIVNLIPITKNEKISSILTLPKDIDDFENYNLVFATSLGNIRKNKLKDVAMSGSRKLSRTGKTAIKLKTGDRLIGVISVIENDDVQLATTNGKSIRFATKDLREFSGLGSAGVRGIKLAKDDKVVSVCSLLHNKISIDVRESYLKAKNEAKKDISKINNKFKELANTEEYLLSITENGYGKLSSAYEYRITNRGGSGVTNITVTPKNGRVIQSLKVNLDDNIALISDTGKLLRCNVGDNIRVVGRVSQGVSVFKVDANEKIVSVARLED